MNPQPGPDAADLDRLRRMPKAEVHLHLEGTIGAETLWELARRNHVSLPAGSPKELAALYAFDGFEKFLTAWMAMCSCLKTAADYEQMVDGFVAECVRQNIRYVEAHFTPYNHELFGFGGARALEVVTRRLEALPRDGPVVRLILDIPGESSGVSGPFTARLLEDIANPLVVALGLGGPEAGFPRSLFAPFFERAQRAGYRTVAHAGETAGADHVRQAVLDLRACRIQHGVAAAEDPGVLRLLAERGVCCDVALTSNTLLSPYRDLATHPIRRLLSAGVPVTLSTDDPPFFGTTLVREYERAHLEVGLSMDDLWDINLNGLRYGLADTVTRRNLLLEFALEGRALGFGGAAPA